MSFAATVVATNPIVIGSICHKRQFMLPSPLGFAPSPVVMLSTETGPLNGCVAATDSTDSDDTRPGKSG
jgi:hypothetical protein